MEGVLLRELEERHLQPEGAEILRHAGMRRHKAGAAHYLKHPRHLGLRVSGHRQHTLLKRAGCASIRGAARALSGSRLNFARGVARGASRGVSGSWPRGVARPVDRGVRFWTSHSASSAFTAFWMGSKHFAVHWSQSWHATRYLDAAASGSAERRVTESPTALEDT